VITWLVEMFTQGDKAVVLISVGDKFHLI